MRITVAQHTVPGTDVTVTIELQEADPVLAKLLNDRPGKGHWVRRYYITRNPGFATFCNYLMTGRESWESARAEANFLWTDAVTRRDRAKADFTPTTSPS